MSEWISARSTNEKTYLGSQSHCRNIFWLMNPIKNRIPASLADDIAGLDSKRRWKYEHWHKKSSESSVMENEAGKLTGYRYWNRSIHQLLLLKVLSYKLWN